MKKLTALLLALVMILGICSALAADTWDCPNCGRSGNTSQFCPDCGTSKPEEPEPDVYDPDDDVEIKKGDYVYFGHCEQDKNSANGKDPIRWLVLAVEDGKLFLLSEKALARVMYHNRCDGTKWIDSDIRAWLNTRFLDANFTKEEQNAIQVTSCPNNADEGFPQWNKYKRFTRPTEDKIFLLSYKEMKNYVAYADRLCEPSLYLYDSVKSVTERHGGKICCWYWLRTSAFRNDAGIVDQGGMWAACMLNRYGCVRPALWVDASAVDL